VPIGDGAPFPGQHRQRPSAVRSARVPASNDRDDRVHGQAVVPRSARWRLPRRQRDRPARGTATANAVVAGPSQPLLRSAIAHGNPIGGIGHFQMFQPLTSLSCDYSRAAERFTHALAGVVATARRHFGVVRRAALGSGASVCSSRPSQAAQACVPRDPGTAGGPI
jgi:hypothetical protein